MAKTCLKKLNTDVRYDCVLPVHGVKNIYLLNAEDLESSSVDENGLVVNITFASAARTYIVEGFKMNIQYTEELVVGEYTSVVKPTIVFRRPAESDFSGVKYNGQVINSKFVVLVEFMATGKYVILGIKNPLVASALERDSNANGGSTMYTLTTEEGTQAVAVLEPSQEVIDLMKG